MAVSQDEWTGELTKFLDRLPVRPCIVPPPPSFCTVCGRLDTPVATACKFYPLRFEREMGRTTVEPAAFKPRRDTFEIDIGFEEEEEEPALAEAPMIEFERPERPPARAPVAVGRKGPAEEAEVEVVEAELVEVIEDEAEEEKEKGELQEALPGKAPERLKDEVQRTIEDEIEEELKAEVKAAETLRKTDRESWELEQAEQEELLKRAKELEAQLKEKQQAALAKKEEEKPIEAEGPQEKPGKEDLGELEQMAPEAEAATPTRRIAEAVRVPEEDAEGPALAIAVKQPEGEPAKETKPPTEERMTVIAPIYPQPKLKIIDTEKPAKKAEELPLPPPPPDYKGPMPTGSEPTLEAKPEIPTKPDAPIEPVAPAPKIEKLTEEKGPTMPQVEPIEPPAASASFVKKPENGPTPATPPPTGRRTGGLYDIFRRKPAELKKEPAKPENGKGDDKKKQSDEELLKRLKNIDKER